MKNFFIFTIALLFSFSNSFSAPKTDLLRAFIAKIEAVNDISFNYKSGAAEGVISISKDGVYMSQKNKFEVFETSNTRYTYNKRRGKVDIDRVVGGNNVSLLTRWISRADQYDITSEVSSKGVRQYRLIGRDSQKEIIELTFNSTGDIEQLTYQSSSVKRLVVEVTNFIFGGKTTLSYFTFNPDLRSDLDVTDYR